MLSAYHLVTANILHLLLAVDDCAVHPHCLIHKAHAPWKVEAIFRTMVDAFRLLWLRKLKFPWLLTYNEPESTLFSCFAISSWQWLLCLLQSVYGKGWRYARY